MTCGRHEEIFMIHWKYMKTKKGTIYSECHVTIKEELSKIRITNSFV